MVEVRVCIEFADLEKDFAQMTKATFDEVCKSLGMNLVIDDELANEPKLILIWKHCGNEEMLSEFKKKRNKLNREIATLKKATLKQ